MDRRQFLSTAAVAGMGLASLGCAAPSTAAPATFFDSLPRYKGFNLLDIYNAGLPYKRYEESDFDVLAEWGFTFVRLPTSYQFWSSPDPAGWMTIDPFAIEDNLVRAVQLGTDRGIHVNINFHRAPGYCVNSPAEPLDLWTDSYALDACAYHWAYFANRFRDVPPAQLSFNLLNEPGDVSAEAYDRVHRRLVSAIRDVDPDRPIIVDARGWGNDPVPIDFGPDVAISARGYSPRELSSFDAPWLDERWPTPTWPLQKYENDQLVTVDKGYLKRKDIDPFVRVQQAGTAVHVGEFGVYRAAPHDVSLRWTEDYLSLWRDAGFGWAMWGLYGDFGILDSGRADVAYEDFRGHKLDRRLLELLRSHL